MPHNTGVFRKRKTTIDVTNLNRATGIIRASNMFVTTAAKTEAWNVIVPSA